MGKDKEKLCGSGTASFFYERHTEFMHFSGQAFLPESYENLIESLTTRKQSRNNRLLG
jgi:hypothetical protein